MVQSLREPPRMGGVEDGESVDHLGVVHRSRPGDRSAPVVTDQLRGLGTEVSDEAADVGGEQVDGVGLEVLWLRGQVVATRVGSDDPKTRRGERGDLEPPAEPELREAVQENDQRPIAIAGLDVMQRHVADVGVTLSKVGRCAILGVRAGRAAHVYSSQADERGDAGKALGPGDRSRP